MSKNKLQEKSSLRDTINGITERLISELQGEELTPMEKLAFLKTLLPYSVGKLPTAAVNLQYYGGQPFSGRIVELSEDGGQKEEDTYLSDLSL